MINLLWEKYRPRTMDEILLLPRIRKIFENDIHENYIFYGNYGTGKTSLARILIGKYSKDKPYLEINSSLYTSIDMVRTKIEEFCRTIPMMQTESDIKYVFLDEFERMSPQAQDSLKAFIEQYNKNVIFILTTNHVGKISDGIKSRFKSIDFNCNSQQEEKFLKNRLYKNIMNIIAPKESIEIDRENLINLINKKFPDMRSVFVELQNFKNTGSLNIISNVSNKLKIDLYDILYGEKSYEEIYNFLMSNFQEKIDVLFDILGKDFIEWSLKEKRENIDKLFELNYIIADYRSKLETSTDPIILGMTVIGKFRDVLNQ